MEPEPPGATLFCLEPEPTQVGRSRRWLRDLGHLEPVPPKKWRLRNTGIFCLVLSNLHKTFPKLKSLPPQSTLTFILELSFTCKVRSGFFKYSNPNTIRFSSNINFFRMETVAVPLRLICKSATTPSTSHCSWKKSTGNISPQIASTW